MSEYYYARFKECKDEIREFQTAKERDEWVNFSDKFIRTFGETEETATFSRIPVTEKQANYIIKTLNLTKIEEEDFIGTKVTIYKRTNEIFLPKMIHRNQFLISD